MMLSWKQTRYFYTWQWRETEAGPPGTPSHSARPLYSGRCTSASCSWVTVRTLYSVQSSSRQPYSASLSAVTSLAWHSVYTCEQKWTFFYQYAQAATVPRKLSSNFSFLHGKFYTVSVTYVIPFNFGSGSQRRQSAKLFFLQSSELKLPHPLSRRRVCPPPHPLVRGRAHSLAGEGLGESQFRRGDIHCGALYIKVLCDLDPNTDPDPQHWLPGGSLGPLLSLFLLPLFGPPVQVSAPRNFILTRWFLRNFKNPHFSHCPLTFRFCRGASNSIRFVWFFHLTRKGTIIRQKKQEYVPVP